MNRIRIFDAPVDCVDMDGCLSEVEKMINSDCSNTIIAINPEKVIKAQQEPRLMNWLNNARLVIPDGIGVVIAARLLFGARLTRVPGSELMPKICELAARRGYRVFLYGASELTVTKAVERLRNTFADINIVGYQNGYLSGENMQVLIDRLNELKPQIIFVALGSPRQELWMDRYLSSIPSVRVCQGVGGTFDVIAGTVRRAPQLFIRLHGEWLYRLLAQPKRILRQRALPLFAIKVINQWFSTCFSRKRDR